MSKILSQNFYFPQKNNMGVFGNITVFSSHVLILQICLEKSKLCLTFTQNVWKKQTRWYIYTWVLFSTHVWILTHMYGKKHTCVKKATQLYICKCWAFSTHVWEKPLTCLFPPELSVICLLLIFDSHLKIKN